MWYIKSGTLQGVSGKSSHREAFLDLFDEHVKQTGRFPDLGVLGAASTAGFDFNPENSIFFLTEWALYDGKRVTKMSHEFDDRDDHMASLFDENNPLELKTVLRFVRSPQDEILNEDTIDAPNSREDFWADVIEVPEEFWETVNADSDASSSGS